jgi:hypothetical protein
MLTGIMHKTHAFDKFKLYHIDIRDITLGLDLGTLTRLDILI